MGPRRHELGRPVREPDGHGGPGERRPHADCGGGRQCGHGGARVHLHRVQPGVARRLRLAHRLGRARAGDRGPGARPRRLGLRVRELRPAQGVLRAVAAVVPLLGLDEHVARDRSDARHRHADRDAARWRDSRGGRQRRAPDLARGRLHHQLRGHRTGLRHRPRLGVRHRHQHLEGGELAPADEDRRGPAGLRQRRPALLRRPQLPAARRHRGSLVARPVEHRGRVEVARADAAGGQPLRLRRDRRPHLRGRRPDRLRRHRPRARDAADLRPGDRQLGGAGLDAAADAALTHRVGDLRDGRPARRRRRRARGGHVARSHERGVGVRPGNPPLDRPDPAARRPAVRRRRPGPRRPLGLRRRTASTTYVATAR